MTKKIRYKYYNKQIKTYGNSNNQSHDQEEIKLNSTNIANGGTNTLTYGKKKEDHAIRITEKLLK